MNERERERRKDSSPAPSLMADGPTIDGPLRGVAGVFAERQDAVDKIRFRMTGGAQGVGPAAHLAAERRAIIGAAAARIMRKASGTPTAATIPQGTGAPLAPNVRSKMESTLGADLSAVRIHTGAESADAASTLGARAFTVGSDIHFNSGEFAPDTKGGDRLLAHELTHVVQGQSARIQRKPDDDGETDQDPEHVSVSEPDEPAEKEADESSEKIADALHGDEKKGDEKPGAKPEKKAGDEKIHAKLEDGKVWLAVDPNDRQYQNWLRKVKLGNPASETNQQLFEHRNDTVTVYVGAFKKGGINSKLPDGAKNMTVEQALIAGEVEGVNVRKLLTDLREKFNK